MEFINEMILHKIFIILYSIFIIYGLYFDYKEKKVMNKRIKDKIDSEFKTELVLEIDDDEKYMLRNLAYDYGYNSIEEFMISILEEEVS